MIPLSLLSSVELGLVMVPQGLERLSGGRLVVLFRVEHGLSVLGDAVLLVSVEQGLMPWLVREHCGEERWKKGVKVHQECTLLIKYVNEEWSQLATSSHFFVARATRQEKKKQQKIIFQPYLEGVLRKITVYFDLDHVKAMQKIPLQINKRFTCEHDTQAEGHKHYKWSKA